MMNQKILMLHGWNWKNYPKYNLGNPWSNRVDFIDSLSQSFEMDTPAMPGFCSSIIPATTWGLDDYADWLFDLVQKKDYEKVLGYSFGAAVITRFLTRHSSQLSRIPEIILVSPAISRQYQHKTGLVSWMSKTFMNIFPSLVAWARDVYLTQVIKNPFYIEGNIFQRETYRNIVGIDLSDELGKLISLGLPIRLIFGSDDTATPSEVLLSKIPSARSVTTIIQHGGHDIANTHTAELVTLINKL